ncbi:MAG: hypothetical protein AAGM38_02785 [Pseudomonadota bacterium]
MIEAAGVAMCFPPPDGFDHTLMEMLFTKLKHRMSDAAERIVVAVGRRAGPLLDRFSPDERGSDLARCGYASEQKRHALG